MSEVVIPRHFHWIWFGHARLPDQHRRWIDGWLDLHPGWESTLWTDENRPTFVNEAEFQAADSYAQKADVARYELVHRYGGVYIDTDTECLRCIDPLLEDISAFAALGCDETVQASPIGATPRHAWLAEAIAALPASMKSGWGNLHQAGPAFLTRVTSHRTDVTIFDKKLFVHQPESQDTLTEAYAVHHGSKTWEEVSGARYRAKLDELVTEDIEPLIPRGETFILVSKGLAVPVTGERRCLPFPERSGEWAGYPADDADAIAELERLRARGARFVVIPAPMSYWLAAYPGWAAHLRHSGRCILANERATIFLLSESALPASTGLHGAPRQRTHGGDRPSGEGRQAEVQEATAPTLSYLICATPRSGSTLLAGLLDTTGVAGHPREYFWHEDREFYAAEWRIESLSQYVTAVLAEGTTPNGVFGAKVMWGYINDVRAALRVAAGSKLRTDRELFESVLPALHFIWLWREDVIAQAVSFAKAIQTDQWSSEMRRRSEAPPVFDFEQIGALREEITTHNEAWEGWFTTQDIRPLRVRYEDLLQDQQGAVINVLRFLGLSLPPGALIEPQTRKQSDGLNAEWTERFLAMDGDTSS